MMEVDGVKNKVSWECRAFSRMSLLRRTVAKRKRDHPALDLGFVSD